MQASTSTGIRDQSISLNDNSSDNVLGKFIINDSSDNEIRPNSALLISTNSSSSETKSRYFYCL